MSETRPKRKVEMIESYWTGGEYGSDYKWDDNHGELVRCKDCKHWYFADNRIPCEQENVCGRNGIVVTPEWYCADGERRKDDD